MAQPISTADLDDVFSDEAVARFAKEYRLPSGLDLARLAAGIRDAARLYVTSRSRRPDPNRLPAEIEALHAAAKRKKYDKLAAAIMSLSPTTRDFLNARGRWPSLSIALPDAADLADPDLREKVRDAVLDLCVHGGRWEEGRRRPSGKRSRRWVDVLYAPAPDQHPKKREAERTFLMWLRIAWREAATGEAPAPASTAHHVKRGPFVRLLKWCLTGLGAGHVDAVELINTERSRQRKWEASR